jgi:hypothetical protein
MSKKANTFIFKKQGKQAKIVFWSLTREIAWAVCFLILRNWRSMYLISLPWNCLARISQFHWDSDLELTLSISRGAIHLGRRDSLLFETSWGCGDATIDRLRSHTEPDVARFQMMSNLLFLSDFSSWPNAHWEKIYPTKSNSKLNVQNRHSDLN